MSKTPVSILQELMVKNGLIPNYEWLANSEGLGTHLPTFHYKVTAGPVQATGIARSKKDAKHEAARIALEKLAALGLYGNEARSFNLNSSSPLHSSPELSPGRVQINAVGALQTLCAENNIPQPNFQIIADVGPAHLRHFTFECKVAAMTVTATDLTKKKAKQLAAQKMLHRLMDTLPEEMAEFSSDKTTEHLAIEESTEEIIKTYNELSVINKKKINLGLKIAGYSHTLKKVLQEKGIKKEELCMDTYVESIDALNKILSKLDLKCFVEILGQEESVIAFISLNSEPEYIVTAISSDKEKATSVAVGNMFNFIKTMIN